MIKFNFKNLMFACYVMIMLAACSLNEQSKTDAKQPKPLITYKINKPKALDKNEFDRIYSACKMFYDTTLLPSGFNGGIIVAKGGNIVFEKYRGSINLDGVDSMTANTPLHIASVSKTFTAMAILKLQEQGKLNINDTLTKYFSGFNYDGVTIKTLLNHRSGLPNYLHFLAQVGWPEDSLMHNKDIVNLLISKKALMTDLVTADTKFTYCNTNYALLALIIEKVSGMPYPQFMKENIFDPIGMKNTFVRYNTDTTKLSQSFDWKGRRIYDTQLDAIYGDKNIYSTPEDLLKWDRLLADSMFLSPQTLVAAYTPYSNEKPGVKNYGLGWRMNIYDDGKKIIFHNGWWHGNNAAFIRLVKDDVTIIALSNRFARSTYHAKILVNIFGDYFNVETEDAENIVPSNIPEQFSVETKKGKKGKLTKADSLIYEDKVGKQEQILFPDKKIKPNIIKEERSRKRKVK
jgi:CubicO group peptidase (beta-lactamase class C family)